MKRVVYHHPETGAYISDQIIDDHIEPVPPQSGEAITLTDDLKTPGDELVVSIQSGRVEKRKPMPLDFIPPDRIVSLPDELRINNIPPNTVVIAELPDGDSTIEVNDGVLEIESIGTGEGRLTFINNTHLAVWDLEVTFE